MECTARHCFILKASTYLHILSTFYSAYSLKCAYTGKWRLYIINACHLSFTALMHATIFGNVTAIIQRIYGARKSEHQTKWRNLKDFTILHSLPKQLKQRMQDYFQTLWSLNHGIDPVEVSFFCKSGEKSFLSIFFPLHQMVQNSQDKVKNLLIWHVEVWKFLNSELSAIGKQ